MILENQNEFERGSKMSLRTWIFQKTGIRLKEKSRKRFESVEKDENKNQDMINDPYGHVEYGAHVTLGNEILGYPVFAWNCKIGDYTYFAKAMIGHNCFFGRYCSFGTNLLVSPDSHPTNWLSTHPLQYNEKFKKIPKIQICHYDQLKNPPNTVIGNDVWCGHNVTILQGVKIGDGAIIGTGAVVTKDVAPYGIAVGVPARVVKYRFDEKIIKELIKIKWWELEADELDGVDFNNIHKALQQIKKIRLKLNR